MKSLLVFIILRVVQGVWGADTNLGGTNPVTNKENSDWCTNMLIKKKITDYTIMYCIF